MKRKAEAKQKSKVMQGTTGLPAEGIRYVVLSGKHDFEVKNGGGTRSGGVCPSGSHCLLAAGVPPPERNPPGQFT
ncbi:hypothetical protein CEXT_711301 [Caerostris extrusa]|uniref:Uncharacterized protein n=1 Tax=Caerostris extrusa TaxID=172846 RepID=A0AAV4Y5H8_CAEEX|nr:hypothetical protein CEXT_711301 [Caerostris extrusa]